MARMSRLLRAECDLVALAGELYDRHRDNGRCPTCGHAPTPCPARRNAAAVLAAAGIGPDMDDEAPLLYSRPAIPAARTPLPDEYQAARPGGGPTGTDATVRLPRALAPAAWAPHQP